MWKNYYTVTSIDEALDLLAEHRESARIIAGGTDIMIELERGSRKGVTALIDITRVPGMDDITIENDTVMLGALVTHNHIVGDERMVELALPLAQACWEVGAPQIRNRATIAGNLITASPANDTITPLMALGASVVLRSKETERTVPLADFYTGFRQNVMQPDEMMTAVTFPAMAENTRAMFYKLGLRRAQAISVVNATAVLQMDGDTIQEATITLGSVAPTIIRVPNAENALIGNPLTRDVIDTAARAAAATPTPIDDVRGTAEYRSEMVRVLVSRVLRQLRHGNPQPVWGHNPAMLWGSQQARVSEPLPDAIEHDEAVAVETTINGKAVTITTGQDTSLLHFLRDHAGLPGTKVGCSEGECGACTVFLDDVAVMSCMVPAPRAHGAEVVTVEGLRNNGSLHPIQEAFVAEGAVQCGYCTPGFLMAGASLLSEHPEPTKDQIQQSISGNLCRCTGYYKIVDAFEKAGQLKAMEDRTNGTGTTG
ncbi:MAG: FAD binding domain-containing protein [Chloroflexota bacterium]